MSSDNVGTGSGKLLETPLAAEHVALSARMVPFAGWNMPVQYSEGILAEHKHTRESVSLFDICHMGEFRVKGPGAAEALDAALARAVADQKISSCRYNFLLNEKGCVLDDLIVYRIREDEFYIVVNASRIDNDAAELRKRLPAAISFKNESDATAKLDLQGPLAAQVLIKLGLKAESLPEYYHWTYAEVCGIKCILSRTGYTGELGYELYFEASKAIEMWRKLLSVEPVKPAGLGARDTLRLEMGYPLYGHEMNENTTPVEAGFGQMLKLQASSRKFVGSDALRWNKPSKQLVGLVLEGRRAAREGAVVMQGGKKIGVVSSGTFGPSIGNAVAMAHIDSAVTVNPGDAFEIDLQRASVKATVEVLPFYKAGTAREKIKKN